MAVEEIVGGSYAKRAEGESDVRVFLVDAVTGAKSAKRYLATLETGVPAQGEAHPDITGVSCISVISEPAESSASAFYVRCGYGVATWRNAPTMVTQDIRIDTTFIEEKTWFDINDVRLKAVKQPPPTLVEHYPSATRAITRTSATISKLELTPTSVETDALFRRSIDYVGAVNNAPWFGWEAKTWLCEDMQIRKSNLPGYTEVETVVTYNPDTWRFLAEYIQQGRLPPGSIEGDGFAYFDIRELRNFMLLPFTIPNKTPPP